MKLHIIDYGHGKATFLTDLDGEDAERQFGQLANECFGIRKSMAHVHIEHTEEVSEVATVIEHTGGDIIIFDKDGKKLRDEYSDWGHTARWGPKD